MSGRPGFRFRLIWHDERLCVLFFRPELVRINMSADVSGDIGALCQVTHLAHAGLIECGDVIEKNASPLRKNRVNGFVIKITRRSVINQGSLAGFLDSCTDKKQEAAARHP